MVLFNRKIDYAILALYSLMRSPQELSAQKLANQYRLSRGFIANILKQLCAAGLITSSRGTHGGYRLARSPAEITLGQIIIAMEGEFRLSICSPDHYPVNTYPSDGSEETESAPNVEESETDSELAAVALPASDPAATETAEPAVSAGADAGESSGCDLHAICPVRQPLQVVHERLVEMLNAVSLQDLEQAEPTSASLLQVTPIGGNFNAVADLSRS